jgi:hypothetical protein
MKIEIALAIVASTIALLDTSAPAETSSRHPKSGAPHKSAVTLETVLSCADDSLVDEVFKTDWYTARFKLDGLLMAITKNKADPDYLALRSKRFETDIRDKSSLEIVPTDALSGHRIAASDLPFCHSFLTARYDESDHKSGPRSVDIDGEDWLLNPNEILAHADQFHFDSGVFTNSSDVFFTATKGRVSIQFVCKPDGLKFYRALYVPSD